MNINNFNDICVVGFGRSGIALCELLFKLNKKVRVTESAEVINFSSQLVNSFIKKGIKFEFGQNSHEFIKGSDLVIVSPGVDLFKSKAVLAANELRIMCIGEIEFASWLTKAKIIAITGTNGKTTTSYLTHKILSQHRKRVFLGGNIGVPFSSFVLDTKSRDLIILEVSSFQLETILEFRPHVAVLLNIEPDHLDRYSNFQDYYAVKLNIFKNQRLNDHVVLNKIFKGDSSLLNKAKSKVVYYSDEFSNEDYSCVYRIVSLFGLSKVDCMNIFSKFFGLPHRLEKIRELEGVVFINDSKATNPSSTAWALKNMKRPVILLAGGKDKGFDYILPDNLLKKVKKVNLFGEASGKIKKTLGLAKRSDIFSSMEEAILSAFSEAKRGDVILLSPMCSSFDMFSNYEERGKKFAKIVGQL